MHLFTAMNRIRTHINKRVVVLFTNIYNKVHVAGHLLDNLLSWFAATQILKECYFFQIAWQKKYCNWKRKICSHRGCVFHKYKKNLVLKCQEEKSFLLCCIGIISMTVIENKDHWCHKLMPDVPPFSWSLLLLLINIFLKWPAKTLCKQLWYSMYE